MIFVSSLKQCSSEPLKSRIANADSCAVTIGNFDGMHRGHQELFSHVLSSDNLETNSCSVFLTFEPHPRVTLARMKEGSPRALRNYRSITPLRRKIEIAEEFGFDVAYAIKFNSEFSQTTSKDFIRKYIVDVFNPNVVIVGYDWSFGRGREGTPETLKEYGKAFGFDVKVVEPVALDGVRVSSSEIRQALSVPDLKLCKKLLGRDFDVSGVVRQGAKIGRTIGFPTANIKPGRSLLPPFGVYITTTHIDGVVHNSVTNIGKRPSVGGDEVLLETHILDDHPYELYGSRIRISLLSFLRGEERFANLEQLRKQIAKDVELAKRFHSERSS